MQQVQGLSDDCGDIPGVLECFVCFRIPAVTEVGAGMKSTTGPVTVTRAGRGRDVRPTSMSALSSPVVTEEPARTGWANTPVTVWLATTGTTVSWMLTSVTGTN